MKKVYPLTAEQIQAMAMHMKKNKNSERDLLMFSFMLAVPFRVSDVSGIKVEDVYEKDIISKKQQKTGKRVTFPVPVKIKKAIKEYVDKNKLAPYDYLFTSQKGGRLSGVQVYRIINGASKKAGIKFSVGCHSTRKTWAVQALKKYGADSIPRISEMLGHSKIENTRFYLHMTEEQDREFVEGLPLHMFNV